MQSSEVSSELLDIIQITNVTILAHSRQITVLPLMTPTALTARIRARSLWHKPRHFVFRDIKMDNWRKTVPAIGWITPLKLG